MSSDENEGGAADPIGQFDAFRARQAEERAQQEETQSAYAFPPEYAAPPEPVFYPTQPMAAAPANRTRSVLIFVGAVLVAGVLGLGAWLAFGSSSSPAATAASSGSSASASPSPTSSAKRALTFRVTIVSLGTDSFTGTVLSNGESVTVTLTDKTRFGTKAQAFSRADLHVGELVAVRGKRTGTATVTATEVAQAVRSSA
ncbi:hypothetical protein [Actinospica sp.]|jgi:hypothetical protein|uniref:hypothetical protein n=1 Tax=Actinospica sp. TaxID=1872142 RepID=UPI002CFC8EF7|nr:hypothetical protein [Actinospica sp.]HWG27379.1 hypothetical protein [Actinospica sp.]